MYFESVFIKADNFYMNIYNINLSKKFMKKAYFSRLRWVDPLRLLDSDDFASIVTDCCYKLFSVAHD